MVRRVNGLASCGFYSRCLYSLKGIRLNLLIYVDILYNLTWLSVVRRCSLVRTSASHLSLTLFKYRPENLLYLLRYLVFFLDIFT